MWYFHGQLHRTNGPAVEHIDGRKDWWFYNKLHRINGPAVEYGDGTKKWYYDDKQMIIEEYNTIMYYRNLYQVIIRELIY